MINADQVIVAFRANSAAERRQVRLRREHFKVATAIWTCRMESGFPVSRGTSLGSYTVDSVVPFLTYAISQKFNLVQALIFPLHNSEGSNDKNW